MTTPIRHASLLIDGTWRGTERGIDVLDPATQLVLARVADAGVEEAVQAVDAAARAQASWRVTPVENRAGLLARAADAIAADVERLAAVMVSENGKPLAEARGEVFNCARILRWSGEEARRASGRMLPPAAHGPAWTISAPVGPAYVISPWNFPGSMFVRKLALALAAGCTVVAKPSELTPLIAMELTRALHDAGVPAGALNLLTTSEPAAVTEAVLADDRIRKVSFTGSTRVGLKLAAASHGRLRRVSLELGGHSPAIVLADADLDAAAARVVAAKFANAGQSCTAINRVYVPADLVDSFVERVVTAVAALRLGHGATKGTTTGPLISERALEKVQAHVDDAVELGARVAVGGSRWTPDDASLNGAFFEPTVLVGATRAMLVAREETFGPVLPVFAYGSLEEAVERANDSEYGLAAYVFGRDLADLLMVTEALEFGVIGVNDPFPVRPELPFGGLKNSGQEREGGSEGIDAYLETKSISVRW